MDKPNFSIVMIAKNEANTLPRCMESLKEFRERGGEIVLVDTGSTDDTVSIARSFGCVVEEKGETFITVIDEGLAQKINDRFVIENEKPIVEVGNRLFDFAAARNYATLLATNNMVCTLDADEAYSTMNIDEINKLIDEGYGQFEYQFVFAHDQYGKPTVQFVQSKFFDKTKIQWTGVVHEVLHGEARRKLLGPEIIYLEHWQEPAKDHRGNYLVGLALDCFQNPEKDRQSHYLAREMLWTGRPKSALAEFGRHIKMGGWLAEKAQSMIFMGDCYGAINKPDDQVEWYSRAFQTDPNRREALIKLARFYQSNGKHLAVLAYAKGAMEIPWTDYYANDKTMYEQEPHELLYRAYGWTGNIPAAQEHILKALTFQPLHAIYLRDLRYYFKLPKLSIVIPNLGRKAGLMKCIESIYRLNYPKELIETIVLEDEPRIGVPKRLKEGVSKSTGEFVVYGANDMEFDSNCLITAWVEFLKNANLALVSFNEGPVSSDKGNICTHFMFRKADLWKVDGEIFDTEFNHVGVDNLLWAKCDIKHSAKWNEWSKIIHHHWSKTMDPDSMDEVTKIAWNEESVKADRALLAKKLQQLQ